MGKMSFLVGINIRKYLRSSIGIEIDTWLNYHLNGPREGHVAIIAANSMECLHGFVEKEVFQKWRFIAP